MNWPQGRWFIPCNRRRFVGCQSFMVESPINISPLFAGEIRWIQVQNPTKNHQKSHVRCFKPPGIPMKLPFSPEFRFLNSNPRKLDMFSIWFPYDFPIFGASTPMNSSTQEPPTSCARIGRSSWQRYDSRDSVLMVTEVLGGAVDVIPYNYIWL